MLQFKNLEQLKKRLKTQKDCLTYFESIRFEEGYFCPHCGNEPHYKLKKEFQYRCATPKCRKTFNVLTGTIFHNTHIPLTAWFTAIYLLGTLKRGINSVALSEILGIRQATCWFMLHRIREGFRVKGGELFTGTIEADESYVSGKLDNKHKRKIDKMKTMGRGIDQESIISVVERGGRVRTVHTPDVSSNSIYKVITDNVQRGERLITDGFTSYNWVGRQYKHVSVKHNPDRITYGDEHTNNVECYFSHFKRMIYGTYYKVSAKHLQRYCDEMDFRQSSRKTEPSLRFDEALRNSNTRLTYKALTQPIN